MNTPKRTYTIEEFASLLGLGRSAAYTLARTNRLPVRVIKAGKRMFIPKDAADKLLNGEVQDGG